MANVKIVELPALGRPAVAGDLVPVWDGERAKTVYADVTELPGSGGGGGGSSTIVSVPSPFMVFNDSANYTYDAPSNSATIRDTRLLNKLLYPVYSTQYGGEFTADLLTYMAVDPDDDTKGKLVIPNFQLEDGAHLTITIPGEKDSSGDSIYVKLLADVEMLKLIAAPFMPTALGPNGAKVLWGRPAIEIPPGWQEWSAIRGKVALPQDPDDADFSADIGTEHGSKTVTLVQDNLPEKTIQFGKDLKGGRSGVEVLSTENVTGVINVEIGGIGAPFNIMNPYRIVMYIEFIGI